MLMSCRKIPIERSPQAGPDGFRQGRRGQGQLELAFLLVEQPNADLSCITRNGKAVEQVICPPDVHTTPSILNKGNGAAS